MRTEIHPINGFTYEALGNGLVRVTTKSGSYGIFDWEGRWKEGTLSHADPHYLQYVGGPDLPAAVARAPRPAPPTPKPSGDGEAVSDAYAGALTDQRSRNVSRAYVTAPEPIIAKYVGDPGRETPKGKRSSGISFQELLAADSHPERVPDTLKEDSPMPGGVARISIDRYLTREAHDREVERIWKRAWQFACREDDIPEVGDYVVYDVAHLSYIVVRTGPRTFKAFNNTCLHRGRLLREFDGRCATEFRCPFHGWCWEIDGRLREIPSEWDFPEVREDASQLREAQVGLWGGFVFINPDPECEPLARFLGDLPRHYERYDFEKRYKAAHVAKIMRANWKVTQEAFMEGYHVIATHPQLLLGGGDGANHDYNAFGNWCRAVTTAGSTSPHRGYYEPEDELFARRAAAADTTRELLRPALGDRVDIYCDAELVDGYYNNLFPNFHPWGAFSRICYRFRPYGDEVDTSIMEVMYLVPWPEDRPKPPPAPMHWLGPDELFTEAPELGPLARVLNQDCYNLPKVQAGLKAKVDPYIYLSAFSEGKVRHFHALYDEWLARP